MPRARRLVACLLAVAGGLGAGLLGSFIHGSAAHGVPIGLITALGLSLSVFSAAGLATRSRGPAALAVAGWLLMVLLLSLRRPEGDLVVPGTLLGYLWLLAGAVVAGAAVSWPYGRPPRHPAAPEPGSTAPVSSGR